MVESKGRVVVISGASGKLGGVVAARFAADGDRLALIARSGEEVEALAATLPGGRDRHLGIAADLGSADATKAAAATIRERLGAAAVLLQLVGGYAGGTPFVDGTDGETGAISVPLLGPPGCVGVLALEVRHGDERNEILHAVASIVAAQFVSLCVPPALAEAVNA